MIVAAMVLGVIVGELAGERTARLSLVGTLILDLLKGLAGPLLFFAVVDAFLRTHIQGKSALRMVGIAAFNAALAITIGLTISNVLQPGRYLALPRNDIAARATTRFGSMTRNLDPTRKIDFLGDMLAFVPTSVVKPFLDNAVVSIVILAVLLGAALRRVKSTQQSSGAFEYRAVEDFVATVYRALEHVLTWVIRLVPVAVFAVVAKTVGQEGLQPLRGLVVYLGVGILGLAIQVLVVYQAWIKWVAGLSLRRFWAGAREAIVYAMGTGSSLATLPVTLRGLERMGVSPQSARMAACVGTNLNNDGILLYEAMAVLFVAQACGLHLTVGEQVLAAASCAVAGIGISGIPEAGLISLLLVIKTVRQIPDAQVAVIVPLLLSVDWLLGRCRAVTNVTSDMLVAVLLDRFEDGVGGNTQGRTQDVSSAAGPASLAGAALTIDDPDGI
jgi:DAACS family dicarboxylate/amino acid:cation (Na+ or H+) symporter